MIEIGEAVAPADAVAGNQGVDQIMNSIMNSKSSAGSRVRRRARTWGRGVAQVRDAGKLGFVTFVVYDNEAS